MKLAGAAAYGIKYWKAGSAHVGGGVSQNSTAITLSAVDAPAAGSGGSYQWMLGDSQRGLDAGSYGGLSLGNNVQLTLTSGTYHFESVWLGNGTQLQLDTSAGNIQIIVTGGFSTGTNVTMTNVGMGDLTVHAGKDIWLGTNFSGEGAYFAHGSALGIGENSRLQGQLYSAGDIWIANNTELSFMAGGGSVSPAAIPEPAGGILLLAGAIVMMFRPARQ